MGHITSSQGISASVDAVFAYVDDYRNTTKYMKDLTKWAPAGSLTHGKGASFQVAMKAGPITLGSVVDITTWAENSAIGWSSTDGLRQRGQWSFKADGERTKATFDLDYELPGGIAGRLLSRAADPIVRGNIDKSVRNLKSQVERAVRTPGNKATDPPTTATPEAAAPTQAAPAPPTSAKAAGAASKPAAARKRATPRKSATPRKPPARSKD
jgi:uncharacterized membrane protein